MYQEYQSKLFDSLRLSHVHVHVLGWSQLHTYVTTWLCVLLRFSLDHFCHFLSFLLYLISKKRKKNTTSVIYTPDIVFIKHVNQLYKMDWMVLSSSHSSVGKTLVIYIFKIINIYYFTFSLINIIVLLVYITHAILESKGAFVWWRSNLFQEYKFENVVLFNLSGVLRKYSWVMVIIQKVRL